MAAAGLVAGLLFATAYSFFCFQRHCVFTFKVTQHQSANVLLQRAADSAAQQKPNILLYVHGRACTITRFNRNRRPDLNTSPTTPTTNHRDQSLYFCLTLTAKLSNQIACTWLETAEAQQTTAGSGRHTGRLAQISIRMRVIVNWLASV